MPPGLGGGFDSELGLTFLEVTPDGGRAQLTIKDQLLQPWGIVHGGVYCSIIESLASVSAHVWLTADGGGGTVVGVNNNTDFLRAISAGTVTAVVDAHPPRSTPAAVAHHHHRRRRSTGGPRAGEASEHAGRQAACLIACAADCRWSWQYRELCA